MLIINRMIQFDCATSMEHEWTNQYCIALPETSFNNSFFVSMIHHQHLMLEKHNRKSLRLKNDVHSDGEETTKENESKSNWNRRSLSLINQMESRSVKLINEMEFDVSCVFVATFWSIELHMS
jgi:hypothetical protein